MIGKPILVRLHGVCISHPKVPDKIRRIDLIADTHDIPIANFGHSREGNIHVNVMIDSNVRGRKIKQKRPLLSPQPSLWS